MLAIKPVIYKGLKKKKKKKTTDKAIRRKENADINVAIELPNLTVCRDSTIKNTFFVKDTNIGAFSEVLQGLSLDTNRNIRFVSEDIARYSLCTNTLLGSYVVSNQPRLAHTSNTDVFIPLFSRVEYGRKFVAVLNPLLGVYVSGDKLVLCLRDKELSLYAVRISNLLKREGMGRVRIPLSKFAAEIAAPSTYGKVYAEMDRHILRKSVEVINENDLGIEIFDYGCVKTFDNLVVFFDVRSDNSDD